MSDFNDLLKEIKQTNLCTWYLLPLTGLTRSSFGEGLFINCYVEKTLLWIIVQVPDLNLIPSHLQVKAVKKWQNERGGFLAYELSPVWKHEVDDIYVQGKYSMFSADVKRIIFERSGLVYHKPVEDLWNGTIKTYTDLRLMALEGREELRQYIAEQLNVPNAHIPDELLSAPGPESFMDVIEE